MKAKTEFTVKFQEPDEFWFGDGYYEIRMVIDGKTSEEYLVTSDPVFAEVIAAILNGKVKVKK